MSQSSRDQLVAGEHSDQDRSWVFDLSIVIPTLNGAATLPRQLEAVLSQRSRARYEVIVADNGSTDGTVSIVTALSGRHPNLRIVDASRRRGFAVPRNDGVRAAAAPYLIFCDDDDIVCHGWVEAHWQAFQGGASLVAGAVSRFTPSGDALGVEGTVNRLGKGELQYPNGSNCGFTRAAFDAVGGYNESHLGPGEDALFFLTAVDAGFPLTLVPDARIQWISRGSARAAFKQHLAYGRGTIRVLRRLQLTRQVSLPSLASMLWSLIKGVTRFGFSWPIPTRRLLAAEKCGAATGMIWETLRHAHVSTPRGDFGS